MSHPSLRFADEHLSRILRGEKTATFRYRLDESLTVGFPVDLCDVDGRPFATALVDVLSRMTVERAASRSVDGHQSYSSPDDLLAELGRYYPNASLSRKTELDVVEWRDHIRPRPDYSEESAE